MLTLDKFKQYLHDRGFKTTPQRLAVHEAMMALGHASADMVCDHIHEHTSVRISEASVYNTLSQLSRMGVYHYLLSNDNKLYFDVEPGKHVHLYDRVNHVFRDTDDDEVITMVERYFRGRRWRGYKFEGVEINLICRPSGYKKNSKK